LRYLLPPLQSFHDCSKIFPVNKPPTASKLQKLREKRDQIEAQIRTVSARERTQSRKDDTRKKIIAGALALHHAAKNPDDAFTKKLMRLLDEYVVKPHERALFNLPPLPNMNDDTSQTARSANDADGERVKPSASLKTNFDEGKKTGR
jgi:hypothetical protein